MSNIKEKTEDTPMTAAESCQEDKDIMMNESDVPEGEAPESENSEVEASESADSGSIDSEPKGEGEPSEGPRLLFRDTDHDLMDNAVHSLNKQGLSSVELRTEGETSAIYVSEEEFDAAKEQLIEILKDEAENLSERARTLEANQRLREMEKTELAPGFRPYKTPKERYEDSSSTAAAFLVVGGLGLLFIIFEYFGIFFSLNLEGTVRYIFYPTMLVMFAVFLVVGFVSLHQASKWKEKVFEEVSYMNNVRAFTEHDLVPVIQSLMVEKVVREVDISSGMSEGSSDDVPKESSAGVQDAEDAFLQLSRMLEEGAGEPAEATDETAKATCETAEAAGRAADATDKTDAAGETEVMNEAEAADEVGEAENSVASVETDAPKDSSDIQDLTEMENAFNDYYVMEHEIRLRLLKEFPDMPAAILAEATEYAIELLESKIRENDTEDMDNTDPEDTDPEDTDPEDTDPEDTDPEDTDPENTDAENTDAEIPEDSYDAD